MLINLSSGNAKKAMDNQSIRDELRALYGEVKECCISEENRDFDIGAACEGYDALAVCGGDGTFNSALNAVRHKKIELLYVPCGTLNDTAHTLKSIQSQDDVDLSDRHLRSIDLGELNDTLFSYVAATGTFTAIGFIPKTKYKKRFKRLVYYLYALKEYRPHKINAKIQINGQTYQGVYTLILAVKSKYVFGFPFNKLYKHNSGKGHLLLINTPKGLFKLTKLFFRFFRAFFIGFRKEVNKKNLKFIEFSAASIDLDEPRLFCLDGERYMSPVHNVVKFKQKATKILVK
jgi:diacylglycerol kinase family enzyme